MAQSPRLSCVSIDAGCFYAPGGRARVRFTDRFDLLAQLATVKSWFQYPLLDIGPRDAFRHFPSLLETVRGASKIGYPSRLLTTGTHFSVAEKVVSQFQLLKDQGVERIILRLDENNATQLAPDCIANYIAACSALGCSADVIFEYQDSIPEAFYRIACIVEKTRFFNNLYFRRTKKERLRISFDDQRLPTYDRKGLYRLVIEDNGVVLLRSADGKLEILLGNARNERLRDLLSQALHYLPGQAPETHGA